MDINNQVLNISSKHHILTIIKTGFKPNVNEHVHSQTCLFHERHAL